MAALKLCECGCGETAPIADANRPTRGQVKGEPLRFRKGHCNRIPRRYVVDPETGCWVWQNGRTSTGYGRTRADAGGQVLAHRYFYEQAKGPIPAGLQIDHLCRNRACVNPDHLEAVTSATNTLRGAGTKFTSEQVAAIRACATVREAVERVGVSEPHARQIRNGRKRVAA